MTIWSRDLILTREYEHKNAHFNVIVRCQLAKFGRHRVPDAAK